MPINAAYKVKLLLSSLLKRPTETYDRLHLQLTDRWRTRPDGSQTSQYTTREWGQVLSDLSSVLGQGLDRFMAEPAHESIVTQVLATMKEKVRDAPFRVTYNGDRRLADLCYSTCRALRPQIVVETGVAYGVTSAYILQAMAENGVGTLHSIDLPPVAALDPSKESYIGILIPSELRDRWRLHRGTSARILPDLLPTLGQVEMAVLDSRFTYDVKFGEMRLLEPALAPHSILIADDIDRSSAFADWIVRSKPLFSAVIEESKEKAGSMMGISIQRSASLGAIDKEPEPEMILAAQPRD